MYGAQLGLTNGQIVSHSWWEWEQTLPSAKILTRSLQLSHWKEVMACGGQFVILWKVAI